MKTTTLQDIIMAQTPKTDKTKKQTEEIVRGCFAQIRQELLDGNRVKIPNLGVFLPVRKPKRNGVVPQTGEKKVYPERTLVIFRVSKSLKEQIRELVL